MVHSFDDMQRKLWNPISYIQFNGFCLLIQVEIQILNLICDFVGDNVMWLYVLCVKKCDSGIYVWLGI